MNTNTHLLIQKSDQGQILRLENKTAKVYNDLSTVSRKIPVMLNGFEKIVEERIRKAQKKENWIICPVPVALCRWIMSPGSRKSFG